MDAGGGGGELHAGHGRRVGDERRGEGGDFGRRPSAIVVIQCVMPKARVPGIHRRGASMCIRKTGWPGDKAGHDDSCTSAQRTRCRLRRLLLRGRGCRRRRGGGASAGLSSRSILALSRSLARYSDCALRATKLSSCGFTCSKSGSGLRALVLDPDDVPAEGRLHRLGELALVQLEGGFGEFRHHLVLGEKAEVAAFRRSAGILGLGLGQSRRNRRPFPVPRGIAFASSSVSTRMWRACTSSSGFICLVASS